MQNTFHTRKELLNGVTKQLLRSFCNGSKMGLTNLQFFPQGIGRSAVQAGRRLAGDCAAGVGLFSERKG